MSFTDPMGRFARDFKQATDEIADTSEPHRQASELIAAGIRDEAPVVTGYLVSTVYVDDLGAAVGAIYAGVVHDNNPYAERAIDRVDWLAPFADHVDDALDSNLHRVYA